MVQRFSDDYGESLTEASFSALLELALTLKSYGDSIVLVGGWVPYLLIDEFGRKDFKHVGSIDIDLAVNPEQIDADAYATIVEMIEGRGYKTRLGRDGNPIAYSFSKPVQSNIDGKEHMITVDFLTYATSTSGKHRHRTVQAGLPARIAGGCELAFRFNYPRKITGMLPGNGEAEEFLSMLDIPGCLGMKGIALGERYKEKDAYDIYSVIGYCLKNPIEVAKKVKPHLADEGLRAGIDSIEKKFRNIRAEGPSWVGIFTSVDSELRKREQAAAYSAVREFLDNI
ncbi:MAG: hypothetical protein KKH41_01230 [Candidatus Thermoplasmatota archaeon]|nr:hypothetical protein [Euryarchaeota archaeon]MBU4033088.1 hypothetical protein [Candidatus Thermoplasmatota archaeon]MBU4072322.1 hypothetical protein [Candidatus Thermoplasmatota archaeon]MBU4143358.1 hypothetical protein [Candidatus Thermoplasmatota archaeon]MBU4591184.1 hypothetical protein [Candidatus Thermoplasmatota archaeon]